MAEPLQFQRSGATPLVEVRQWVVANLESPGVICPCCHRVAARRKRALHAAMGAALVLIGRWHMQAGNESAWLHVEEYFKGIQGLAHSVRSNFALLRHWGLLERKPGERDDGNPQSGYYRITPLGLEFAVGRVRVPAYLWFYRDTPSADPVAPNVTIQEVLGTHFNYQELLDG